MMRMWQVEKDGSRKVATGPFRLVVHPGSADSRPLPVCVRYRRSRSNSVTAGTSSPPKGTSAATGLLPRRAGRRRRGDRQGSAGEQGPRRLRAAEANGRWALLVAWTGRRPGDSRRRVPSRGSWSRPTALRWASICGRWYAVDAANRSAASPLGGERRGAVEESRETTQASSTCIEVVPGFARGRRRGCLERDRSPARPA